MKSHERLSRKMMAAAGQYTRERDYWLEKLAGEPVKTTFPYDYSPAERTGSQPDTVPFTIDGDLFGQLLKLSNRSDVRLFVTLTTAVKVLLHIYNAYKDGRDILVGVPIYQQEAAGKLLNTVLPIRSHIATFITGKHRS